MLRNKRSFLKNGSGTFLVCPTRNNAPSPVYFWTYAAVMDSLSAAGLGLVRPDNAFGATALRGTAKWGIGRAHAGH